jgi:hypothetical protein
VSSTPAVRVGTFRAGGTSRVQAYIRNASFDATLLVVPVAAGLTAAAMVVMRPLLFPFLLVADLWLLGYHHVVATYTRLAFDRDTFARNRFLALDSLLLIVAVTVALAVWAGTWVIPTAFLYLQWFHYMRQSYGISRMYFRTTPAGRAGQARDWATDAVIYAVPIYGIAHRSSTLGDRFLELPIVPLPVPGALVTALGVLAALAVAGWAIQTARRIRQGEADDRYVGFVLSHIAIFATAYVLVDDADTGWLAINVWHNLQYVMVVWMANARRYAAGVDPRARLLSTISQPRRVVAYFATCIAISTIVYAGLSQATAWLVGGGIGAAAALYMGINFNHYVVDAVIWRRRRTAAAPA